MDIRCNLLGNACPELYALSFELDFHASREDTYAAVGDVDHYFAKVVTIDLSQLMWQLNRPFTLLKKEIEIMK